MPLGWECTSKLVKQLPPKPTQRRPTKWDGYEDPGPNHYELPPILGGKGFSKIKRAPQYTFGLKPPLITSKSATAKALIQNIRGFNKKGREHIPQGKIAEKCQLPESKFAVPGPGTYDPKDLAEKKRPPAYSMRIAPKPQLEPWGMWTPSPNMYWPPIIKEKKAPAYSFGSRNMGSSDNKLPGPGNYSPRFEAAHKVPPAFSIVGRVPDTSSRLHKTPAPNAYCEKRFNICKPLAPAPSFGIRHSPYLGRFEEFMLPSDLGALEKK